MDQHFYQRPLQCSKYYWNHGARGVAQIQLTHKQLCADNKRHMERLPETQAIIRMFPWGRLETDGTFNLDIARARFDVLGSSGYGYWSHRGGQAPHAEMGPLGAGRDMTYGGLVKVENFIDGNDLLRKKHLTDEQGWKLPSRLIPYLDFGHSAAKQPVLVTDLPEEISDWRSWYKWRGLPLDSPAALLMAVPLSVYQMLVRCLEITKPAAGSADKRVSLNMEMNVNSWNRFAELALLLPYHDLKVVLFGGAVKALVEAPAKSPAPSPPRTRAVSVHLSGEQKHWTPDYDGKPDALVACNAGLGSYGEWIPSSARLIPQWLAGMPGCTPREDYPIALNPFQRPGQRGLAVVRMPNVSNGFTMTIVKK
ncbi:uncharacterized protein B0H18DRAFT_1011049 [Fomitopsis serialis]|uniref:uncharacterized protein n=1 Tax=Fomitopsis serialis TaxID=139415 RepID=UPI002008BAEB|nr:uncharacterized protein B0H18DRAFT_1011049 [Neoantrodia serialis]KAH9924756.1 hypothetical protein B0H18DRAFT_1011049 [Neoantrodia serialis]